AIRGAGESGRQVPEDLSVTGWGDLPLGAWMHPSLTTVRIDHHRHGVELLEELLRVMRGDDPSMDRPSITEGLWREATGPGPGGARGGAGRPGPGPRPDALMPPARALRAAPHRDGARDDTLY